MNESKKAGGGTERGPTGLTPAPRFFQMTLVYPNYSLSSLLDRVLLYPPSSHSPLFQSWPPMFPLGTSSSTLSPLTPLHSQAPQVSIRPRPNQSESTLSWQQGPCDPSGAKDSPQRLMLDLL